MTEKLIIFQMLFVSKGNMYTIFQKYLKLTDRKLTYLHLVWLNLKTLVKKKEIVFKIVRRNKTGLKRVN